MTECNEMCMEPAVPVPEPPPPDPQSEPPTHGLRVRLNLFFDGTQNNKFNTTQRLNEKSDPAAAKIMARIRKDDKEESTSYFNEYSNVARLEGYVDATSIVGYDHHIKVYIEGIGTRDGMSDATLGVVMGKGSTGVKGKVGKGLALAVEKVVQAIPGGTSIELLTVDTFGFSRGAAAARLCAHRVLHALPDELGRAPRRALKDRLTAAGYPVQKVELDTIGIFDTVSAHGIAYLDQSDVRELYLDSVREARAVLHLAAAEEYRRCFSLTNIQSAITAGVGHEIYLPGAHSDVGGGYTDGGNEEQVIWTGPGSESLAAYLGDNGWYRDRELKYRYETIRGRPIEDLRVARSGISFEYSFLPLRGMADFAAERGLAVDEWLYKIYNPVNVPREVRTRVERCLKARQSNKPAEWQTNDVGLRMLRHNFLHFSSQESLGLELRTLKLDTARAWLVPTRKVFNG